MGERDISNEVKLKNAKANPFGWSTQDIVHDGKVIGRIYCGKVVITASGYSLTTAKEGNVTHARIFVK